MDGNKMLDCFNRPQDNRTPSVNKVARYFFEEVE